MNQRECSRYPVAGGEAVPFWEGEVDGEFIRARILDISLCGIGYSSEEMTPEMEESLRPGRDLFIKIYLSDEFFIAGVTTAWCVLKEGTTSLRGGLKLTIVAPEDNLRLSDFINGWRRLGE